jgi:hypothetical protein
MKIGPKQVLLGLLAILIISICVLASVPPVSRDALTHHLAVPKLYLRYGAICEIPAVVFSYYPMNLDLLYLIPLYLGNDIIPKFIHFAFALATAWIVFDYLKKRINLVYALFGAVFFLSTPVIVKLSVTAYVDLGLIFFSTAALMYLINWVASRYALRFLLFAGLCCGLALGTKYNALIVLFLLSMFIPFVYLRAIRSGIKSQDERERIQNHGLRANDICHAQKALGFAGVFLLVALLVFSPWMVKNFLWTGNPIYPLYNKWFNPNQTVQESETENEDTKDAIRTQKRNRHFGHFAARKVIYQEKWWETALIPVRVFFQGQDNNPKYFDGRLNPFLFFLPLFAVYRHRRSRGILRIEQGIFLSFAALYLVFVFFQIDMRIRWISPIIPPLVILSVMGIHEIEKALNGRWGRALKQRTWIATGFLSAVTLISNAVYLIDQFDHIDPFSFIGGKLSRDAYIERFRPEYAALQFANGNLSEDVKILGVFLGNRRYYCDRELLFGIDVLQKAVQNADSTERIFRNMKERGITHLIIGHDLFKRWGGAYFKGDVGRLLQDFLKDHVELVFSKNGYGLYALHPTSQPPLLSASQP